MRLVNLRDNAAIVLLLALAASVQIGCAARRTLPTLDQPVPGYVPVESSTAEAWDAVVDFLVDNGIAFDFISSEMRVAKITAILASGPMLVNGMPSANPLAVTYADCGTIRNRPTVGWGDLVADIAVRVRPGESGALLKVVVPRMRNEIPTGVVYECVSTGEFEAEAETAIRERLRPIMKSGGL